jgi:protein-S-isoprenylcysteine O-methyltransferase Ste14
MTAGVVLSFAYALGWLPLFFFRVEAVSQASPYYAPSERMSIALSLGLVTLHVSAACLTLSLSTDLRWWRVAPACVLYLSGLAFWLWGRVLIGPLRVRRLPQEPPRQFRRDGAFGVVRHPLYSAVLLAAAAPVLATGRWELGLSFGACVLALAVRAIQEEHRLRAQLGAAYDAYALEVKRLVPFVW